MYPVWLFEADVFGETAEPLKAEIRRQGLPCYTTRQDLLAKGCGDSFGGRRLAADECVISCGCFPFVHFIQLNRSWVPGGWCTPENLACSTYYNHFRPFLLNQRHLIVSGTEAIKDRDSILGQFGRDEQVFIRPDGCQKLFTGRVVTRDDFATALARARYDPTTLVVVAEPRPIALEWRLIIARGMVIAGSQYLRHGVIDVVPDCPAIVRAFADGMLNHVSWRPDEVFMMDICESDGELRLLEINGFSCSAVYPCEYEKLVATVSRLAAEAWERRREEKMTAAHKHDI
jgi:hypothetical protein